MKKIHYIFILLALTIGIASCSEDYLTQEPGGSTITEAQYLRMDEAVPGTVRGIYTLLYAFGGDHDEFGQRSFDMYGDLLCGDMAMSTFHYGWFQTDELGQTYTRTYSFWMYYYEIIRACNKAINALEAQGVPPLTIDDPKSITEEQSRNGYFYAEALAMRGWAYAGLSRYYLPVGASMDAPSVPIYTEADTKNDANSDGNPRATAGELYQRIEDDLTLAIKYFDAYNKYWMRDSKIEVNIDIARILLAYSYLNKGDYEKAIDWAEKAITEGQPHILPYREVLTSGFNNVENSNWLWGENVTVQNTTSLASFFGQCDIYSYSYAGAGDIKGIDKNLYNSIPKWDVRKSWWNNYATYSTAKNKGDFAYAPDGKFFSATSKKINGDRDWLSDNVFMRWELAYLIAAEAEARGNHIPEAQNYLYAITDQRVIPDSIAYYNTWKSELTNQASLLAAIKYNWRIELWGEGYGLQTFRRYGEAVTLGDNHKRQDKQQSPTTARLYTFELPNAEVFYNRFIRDDDAKERKVKK